MIQPKLSILMPTYNDEEYIVKAINSVFRQSYKNVELIVINDGSTDDTEKVLLSQKKIYKDRIKVLNQKNQGQLKAIENSVKLIEGELVTILHSDDEYDTGDMLAKSVEFLLEKGKKSVFCDMVLIDEKSEGEKYNKSIKNISGVSKYVYAFNGGSNVINDIFIAKRAFFIETILPEYVIRNIPYWINLDESDTAGVYKSPYSFYRYRIYSGNYINSDIGKHVLLNGSIRGVISVCEGYYFPFIKIQKQLVSKFGFKPFKLRNKNNTQISKITKYRIERIWRDNSWRDDAYLNSLILYWGNFARKRSISIYEDDFSDFVLFNVNEVREFFVNFKNKNIPYVYQKIMTEMSNGFDTIEVHSKFVDSIRILCDLLNIRPKIVSI